RTAGLAFKNVENSLQLPEGRRRGIRLRLADRRDPRGRGPSPAGSSSGFVAMHVAAVSFARRVRTLCEGSAYLPGPRFFRLVRITMFRFTTAGESHGPALLTIVEGVPAGLEIRSEIID